MAGRPPKKLELIEGHLTKAQIAQRQTAEKALAGGLQFVMSREVRRNRVARKHFERLEEIYKDLDVCDAAFENVINRYCMMLYEHAQLQEQLHAEFAVRKDLLKRREEMGIPEFLEKITECSGRVIALERALAKKREQLLAIERENLLTAQSKLRAVPRKKPEKKPTGIEAYLASRSNAR